MLQKSERQKHKHSVEERQKICLLIKLNVNFNFYLNDLFLEKCNPFKKYIQNNGKKFINQICLI